MDDALDNGSWFDDVPDGDSAQLAARRYANKHTLRITNDPALCKQIETLFRMQGKTTARLPLKCISGVS